MRLKDVSRLYEIGMLKFGMLKFGGKVDPNAIGDRHEMGCW